MFDFLSCLCFCWIVNLHVSHTLIYGFQAALVRTCMSTLKSPDVDWNFHLSRRCGLKIYNDYLETWKERIFCRIKTCQKTARRKCGVQYRVHSEFSLRFIMFVANEVPQTETKNLEGFALGVVTWGHCFEKNPLRASLMFLDSDGAASSLYAFIISS